MDILKAYSELGLMGAVVFFAWLMLKSVIADKRELRDLISNHLVCLQKAMEEQTKVIQSLVYEVKQLSKDRHCEKGE